MIVVYCHSINKGDRFALHRLFNGLNNAFFDALKAVFHVSHNRSFKLLITECQFSQKEGLKKRLILGSPYLS